MTPNVAVDLGGGVADGNLSGSVVKEAWYATVRGVGLNYDGANISVQGR